MLTFAFIYTSIVILAMTLLLIMDLIEAEIIVFCALLVLVVGGVINVKEAFAGFSNHGMLTVGFLFIIAASIQGTGVLNRLSTILMGNNKRHLSFKLFRFLVPVSTFSAFFNNTPIVAMLIPSLRYWANKFEVAPSKLLIPLSYAAILGGTCTLIGTSTNLVVHGLMIENGYPGFTLFEFTRIGLPMAVIGLLFVSFIGVRMLPARQEFVAQVSDNVRNFVVGLKVEAGYPGVGKSVEASELRHLKGLFLFQIERNGNIIAPVAPEETIRTGDRLYFTGLPETIVELQRTPGLLLMKDATIDLKQYDSEKYKTYEVVISQNSPLIGQRVKDSDFRRKYNAVILGIHRSGERVQKKIGDIVLHMGDTLFILADKGFLKKYYYSTEFNLVSESFSYPSKPAWYTPFSIAVLVMMVLTMGFEWLPIVLTAALAAMVYILSKTISPVEAMNSINWSILLIIASSFGISQALVNSGVAAFLAHGLLKIFSGAGAFAILAAVYFMTSFYTEIITNNSAAALMFPIALATATQAGLDPRPFFIATALAASASFATPIGYQTNLMVYGPGGYKFTDFLKIGLPMNIFIGLFAIILLYSFYF